MTSTILLWVIFVITIYNYYLIKEMKESIKGEKKDEN